MTAKLHTGKGPLEHGQFIVWLVSLLVLLAASQATLAQTAPATSGAATAAQPQNNSATTDEINRRVQELMLRATSPQASDASTQDYRIGPNDLLTIKVFEAPEMSQPVRVSAGGEITLPLIGSVVASNLTPRELELVLEELLRRDFIKNPHVSVQVTEMESHTVSVMGAVKQPGVVQIRGARPILEVLALAGGLAADAGSTVHVVRKAKAVSSDTGSQEAGGVSTIPDTELLEIDLKTLLESEDQSHNVLIHPGDLVKVIQADLIYVVGEVKKPGGFPLTSNGPLTVLGALALGEGLTPSAAKGDALIIRTNEPGKHTRIPVDLGRLLKGDNPDITLQAQDVVFIPSSLSKAIARTSTDVLLRMLTFRTTIF
jgi:polysaccharide export outer membrane protein